MDDTSRQPFLLTFLTAVVFVVMLLLATLAISLVTARAGINLMDVMEGTAHDPDRNVIRLAMLLNNLFLFTGTAALTLLLYFRATAARAAGLTSLPGRRAFTWVALLFVVALPLIGFSAYFNLQLDLPEWAIQGEDRNSAIVEQILTMPNVGEFLFALLTIAIVPGFGEELLFRGLLQRRILGKLLPGHLAVWITAAIFSGIHMEFAGFLPRMLLGVLLGYALYFTKSLWAPIILHVLFNGFQVVLTYGSGEFTPDTELPDLPHWSVGVISLILTGLVFRQLLRQGVAAPGSGAPPFAGTA